MTETTATTTAPAPAADDPRRAMAGAIRTARSVVGGVRPDDLDRPTPCTDFTVEELLGHLLGACRRVAAVGRGEDPLSVNTEAPFAPVADWSAAYESVAHEIQTAWTDADALPAEGRELAPFDDVVPTAADAPLVDRLVAWNGRRP